MERSNAWREGFEKMPTLVRKSKLSEGFWGRLIQIGETVDIFRRPCSGLLAQEALRRLINHAARRKRRPKVAIDPMTSREKR